MEIDFFFYNGSAIVYCFQTAVCIIVRFASKALLYLKLRQHLDCSDQGHDKRWEFGVGIFFIFFVCFLKAQKLYLAAVVLVFFAVYESVVFTFL